MRRGKGMKQLPMNGLGDCQVTLREHLNHSKGSR